MMTREELAKWGEQRARHWDDYRKCTDAQLVSAYRRSLKARGISMDEQRRFVRAFRSINSREDRIYFIVSSEDIVERKRARKATNDHNT